VLVYHLLDADELAFPYQRMTLFEGMEGYDDLLVNPQSLREAYLAEIAAFCTQVKRSCRNNLIDLCMVNTSTPFDTVLRESLAATARRRK
jgi:hypothetical protein